MSRYYTSGDWITHTGGSKICGNRPIYCANTYTSILAGDLPVIRLIHHTKIFGTLHLYVKTPSGEPVYLHEFSHIQFFYKPNMIRWELADDRIPGGITLTVGAPEKAEGYLLQVQAQTALRLYYSYGGFVQFPVQVGAGKEGWNLSVSITPELKEPFLNHPSESAEIRCNTHEAMIQALGGTVYLRAPESAELDTDGTGVSGSFAVSETPTVISVFLNDAGEYAFSSAIARSDALCSRFHSTTPDALVDTAFNCLAAEIDGAWKCPLTDHGNTAYTEPLLGWCNRFGNALGGWYDRCLAELRYFAARQSKSDKKQRFTYSKKHLETIASHSSRFYGKGHIGKYQHMYNMQTQFFDQMIFAWRMSGDKRLGKVLYQALKLHTRWQDDCFDPDGDGLYESYINSWPTDSVWYNGGGSCEETCYAYRSHTAAAELAEQYGDIQERDFHRAAQKRIEKGFWERLWLRNDGYPAMMRENGFYERLHTSAWLYNCFLPVDTGLTDALHSASCLWYSKWGLENVRQPLGGRMVWMSNWVPSVWSVRKLTGGENFQLAYAFFKAGFAEEGYDLLVGASLKGAYDEPMPASTGSEAASLMARAVICGMHGYEPDYPNGRVSLSPRYPAVWKQASVGTAYLRADYQKTDGQVEYCFALTSAADVTLNLPVPVSEIVEVSGASDYSVLPGFSTMLVRCALGHTSCGKITVQYRKAIEPEVELAVKAVPGETVSVPLRHATRVMDIQEIVEKSAIDDTEVRLTPKNISGTHILFAECTYAGNRYYRLIRMQLSETAAEKEKRNRASVDVTHGEFTEWPIAVRCNGAVQRIFKQRYESPFRDINRLSIGTDGYSPWTFTFWGKKPPEISLRPELQKAGTVCSERGIPFRWNGAKRNIAFTSLWRNWPSEMEFPIQAAAKAIHFLIAGSTNPMQCGIANAELVVRYASGKTESIDLIHPDNFWSLCGYDGAGEVADQSGANDYSYETDAFCLPENPPEQIHLGDNCRACVVSWRLLPEPVESVTLRTLSQEVIVGLCAITIQN